MLPQVEEEQEEDSVCGIFWRSDARISYRQIRRSSTCLFMFLDRHQALKTLKSTGDCTVCQISTMYERKLLNLARYIKFHQQDLAIISQFQCKQEASTNAMFFDQFHRHSYVD